MTYMKETPRLELFVVVIFCGLSGGVLAGTVFEQLPNRTSGQASDTDYLSFEFGPFWQLEADNVRVSTSALIRHITWWGFYGSDFDESPTAHDPPAGDESMRVRFYGVRPGDGLPDSANVLFEESFLNPSRVDTGFTVAVGARPSEYQFDVDLGSPFHMEAGVLYWLEIAQVGDQASHYRWERGTGLLSGRAFSNPIVPDWESTVGSFSVSLSTIPEPGTGLLVLFGLSYLLTRRGRMEPRA